VTLIATTRGCQGQPMGGTAVVFDVVS